MIYGEIDSIAKFTTFLPSEVNQILLKLKNGEFWGLQTGRHEYLGEDIYISADEYLTQLPEERKYEFHHKYVDLQYLIEGEEKIYLASSDLLLLDASKSNKKVLSNGNDCWLVEGIPDESSITLKTGNFLIILPENLHKPCCISSSKIKVKKLVFKIDRSIFER